MKTKRFHLKDSIVTKRQKYQKKILAWERFLSMPITTKSHMIEEHLEQQEQFHGIGDLTKDFGEQNHQCEAKADRL